MEALFKKLDQVLCIKALQEEFGSPSKHNQNTTQEDEETLQCFLPGVVGEETDGTAQTRKEGLGGSGAAGGVDIVPHHQYTFGATGVQSGAVRGQRHRMH